MPCVVGWQPPEALAAIEARAEAVGAAARDRQPATGRSGRSTAAWPSSTRPACWTCRRPRLIGAHQVANAGIALAALRALGADEAACAAAVTSAEWPARLQRLRHGPLVEAAGAAELWLDGGHNPAAGEALAEALTRLPPRPLHLVCGMLEHQGRRRLPAPARRRGPSTSPPSRSPARPRPSPPRRPPPPPAPPASPAETAAGVADAVAAIAARDPGSRILICGSLYLAGRVLRDNG